MMTKTTEKEYARIGVVRSWLDLHGFKSRDHGEFTHPDGRIAVVIQLEGEDKVRLRLTGPVEVMGELDVPPPKVKPARPPARPPRDPNAPKRVKPLSRPRRWAAAIDAGRTALAELQAALEQLDEVRQEYEEWKDNLPENLQQSALGEKLDAVADLSIDPACSEIEELLDEAEGLDLPRGFGKD